MGKRLLGTLYILFLCISIYAQAFTSPKREVRAIWLTTIGGLDWPHNYARNASGIERQQEELRSILDQYRRAGINTVLLQTRIRGTMIYPSQYEPWDGCLSGIPGRSPGYDALQFAIDECHKRGMELHAWVVSIPIGKWTQAGVKNLRKTHSNLVVRIGQEGYLNPENIGTANYIADICEEITRNYNVDGIHLDYIRYPETWTIKVSRERGRDYITGIVRAVSQRVKALKPWVKMSCSPVGKFDDLSRYWSHGWNAYTKVCQDAQGWMRNGYMDQLYPMMYFRDDQFFPFAIDWAEQSQGRMVAPGLGIYFLDPKEGNWHLSDVTREMQVLREYGLGQTFFRGKFFTDNVQGIYDFTCRFNRNLALVPAMTWMNNKTPFHPTDIKVQKNGIAWTGTTPYYNIYSSNTWPVDTKNPENLLAIRREKSSIAIPTEGRYFAITGMDEYGNESNAVQSHELKQSQRIDIPLLKCDGHSLTLPKKNPQLDADLVIIETIQGSLLATKAYRGKTLDVSSIPEGYYMLKSLGRKGVTHRLGFFMIKRNPAIPSII